MSVAYGQQQQAPTQGAQQSHAPPIPGQNQQHREFCSFDYFTASLIY